MGILDRLRPRVDPGAFSGRGIPKGLLLDPFMVLGAAQATDQGHTGRLTAITQAANGLSQEQRDQYEVGRYNEESGHRDWHALGSYDKVDREFNALAKAMVDPPPDPDTTPKEVQLAYWRDVQKTCDEYMLAGCIATLPPGRLGSYSVDIDGTAIKTPAKSKYRKSQFILDGDDGGLSDEGRAYKEAQQKAIDEGATNWKDLVPKGPDDRAIWAPGDPTARGGWHSATNKEPAGPYNGYELHLGVLADFPHVRRPFCVPHPSAVARLGDAEEPEHDLLELGQLG